jgi:hypothetical protein
MSRRHHGRPHHHAHGATEGPRRVTGISPAEASAATPRPVAPEVPADAARSPEPVPPIAPSTNGATPPQPAGPAFVPHVAASENGRSAQTTTPGQAAPTHQPPPNAPTNGMMNGGSTAMNGGSNGQCTAPQLRRFIKSRPYVPMHELRRRFGIDGGDDDVTPVRLDPGWVYVGLPGREGGLLGELLKAGEIGYELSLDPRSPIVIGVYPMRPIPRG